MKLVYGDTKCMHCHKAIYATDDLLLAEARPGVENMKKFRSGPYHYDCFRGLDHADAYCALKGAAQYRQLTTPAWRLLAEDPRVAVAWNGMLKEWRVLFRQRGRQITLVGTGEVQEFSLLIQSFLPERSQTAAGSRFDLAKANGGWVLSILQPVTTSLVLESADCDSLTRHLGMTREAMVGMNLALGEVCRKLGIFPHAAGCPLDQASGTIIGIDSAAPSDPVTLRLVVRKRSKVYLTRDDLNSLQAVLPTAVGALDHAPIGHPAGS